jgi:hypothetical protein
MTSERVGDPLAVADLDTWVARSARNNAAWWEHGPRLTERRVARWEDVWAADPGTPNLFPNSATLLRPLAEADAAYLIDRLDAFYGGGPGGPWLLWSPWPTPDLRTYGCQLMGHPPLMVRLPGAGVTWMPPELRVVEARDAAALADWEHVLIEGYPAPEQRGAPAIFDERALGSAARFFIGYVAERPISIAAAYVDAETVSVQAVATLSEARGRGYGAAVTHAAASVEPTLPTWLVSSDLGYRVYERIGFVPLDYRYTLWFKDRVR